MRPISIAATLVAFWLQWSPAIRDWLAVTALRRPAAVARARDARRLGPLRRGVARHVTRFLAIGLLGVAPVALSALAWASPPDPSWVSGYYDGDDFDDIVVRTTWASGDTPSATLPDLRPDRSLLEHVLRLVEGEPRPESPSAVQPRGPPAL